MEFKSTSYLCNYVYILAITKYLIYDLSLLLQALHTHCYNEGVK